MIEAVLFDLDGTLIQFSASYAEFMREMASNWGITDGEDPFFAFYGEAIRSEGAVTFRSSMEFALTASGRSIPEDIEEKCKTAVQGYAAGIELLPVADALISHYKNLPKAIVSNGPSDMQRAALSKVNIGMFFDHVLISGDADVAVRKPNPKIFLQACARLGFPPERTLMIGDNLEADIHGARAAGLTALHVSDFQA